MERSILKDLTSNVLTTYLTGMKFAPRYYPQFFPFKLSPTLQYNTLLGAYGAPVCADIIAYSASAPQKTRKVISRITGDIPKVAMSKCMSENDLNDYMQLRNMKNIADNQLLDLVFDDVGDCYTGVQGRLEWIALKILSYGKLSLSKSTNGDGIVTESAIDFAVPSANKSGASVVWSAASTTTKPITDLDGLQTKMIALGVKAKYVLMSPTSFRYLRVSSESSNFVFGRVAKDITKWPNQDEINKELKLNGLPEIIVIDTSIITENPDHVQTTANPWYEGVVTVIPELAVGNMVYCISAEETFPPPQVVHSKRDNILISKYSEVNPISEWTLGSINAFPSWHMAHLCCLMNSLNVTTWSI